MCRPTPWLVVMYSESPQNLEGGPKCHVAYTIQLAAQGVVMCKKLGYPTCLTHIAGGFVLPPTLGGGVKNGDTANFFRPPPPLRVGTGASLALEGCSLPALQRELVVYKNRITILNGHH